MSRHFRRREFLQASAAIAAIQVLPSAVQASSANACHSAGRARLTRRLLRNPKQSRGSTNVTQAYQVADQSPVLVPLVSNLCHAITRNRHEGQSPRAHQKHLKRSQIQGWPRLIGATLSEADGTRTRNHRIDSLAGTLHSTTPHYGKPLLYRVSRFCL